MNYKVLVLVLVLSSQNMVVNSGHPCHSPVGKSSQICQQIFQHCEEEQARESQLCKSLEPPGLEEKDMDRLDLGVEDLDSAKTSYLTNSLHPDEILWTLSSIPWDLVGFYEHFARGVRRGFNDIVSRISSGGTRLYNDVASIGSSSGYKPKNSQNKISTEEEEEVKEKKKDTKPKAIKDDPSSPYSINYSGELQPNSGYSLKLEDTGQGKKTGFYKYSSPQHSVSVAWPRGEQANDWSAKQNQFVVEAEDDKDTFTPHPKDEIQLTKYNNLDYDAYGNIYLLSEEDTDRYDYDYAPDINVVKDHFGYKSSFSQKENPFERAPVIPRYPDSKLMVNLIKGTENMQQPWIQKPPQQKQRPAPPRTRWDNNPHRRRKSGLVRDSLNSYPSNPGARRFDEFAPNSKERADISDIRYSKQKSQNGRGKYGPQKPSVDYIDYYYY